MPGIFGVVGPEREVYETLRRYHADAWGALEERSVDGGRIGGHSFGGKALADGPDGAVDGIDGVARAYRWRGDEEREGPSCANQVRLFSDGSVRIACSAAGAFPMYYAKLSQGFAFSSLLKPLAKAVNGPPDPVGLATFLRLGYTHNGRTVFRGIQHLRPGEAVTYHPRGGLEGKDESDAWATTADHLETPVDAAKAAARLLERWSSPYDGDVSLLLMMSAGWDSRTLLAVMQASGIIRKVGAYTHGDLASREIGIVRKICEAVGVRWEGKQIGGEIWDLDYLDQLFLRVGTLLFPHWGMAGLNADGCVVSGVLGEVLGGHYGETHVVRGAAKARSLLRSIHPGGPLSDSREAMCSDVGRLLAVEELRRPWYLLPDADGDLGHLRYEMNEDIRRDLERLVRRGVSTRERLIEAFVTEHRGAQYICAQALSARIGADIGLPFAETDLLRLAAGIPPHVKIHNRVNRAFLGLVEPTLCRFPMAATLVPASWPLLLQEGSRLGRKIYEETRWILHQRSGRRLPEPHLGWVNFEFLRDGDALGNVVDSLRADIWDREAMNTLLRGVRKGVVQQRMHPFFDQFGKILTVDRLLGGRS